MLELRRFSRHGRPEDHPRYRPLDTATGVNTSRPRSRCFNTEGPVFNLTVAAVICFNAVVLVLEADLGLLSAHSPGWQALDADLDAANVGASAQQALHMSVRQSLLSDKAFVTDLQQGIASELPKDHQLPPDYSLSQELTVQDDTASPLDYGAYTALEYCFILFFIVELLIRFCDVGCRRYMQTSYCKFELAVILIGLVDCAIPIAPDATLPTAGLGLICSMLRLTRVLRVLRLVWLCRELRLTGRAFSTAMVVVFWTAVLLFVINFVLAVVLTSLIGQAAALWAKDAHDDIVAYFGSVGASMQTLFTVMTLSGWDRLAAVLSQVFPRALVVPTIAIYIMSCCFAMIGLISGVVSDAFVAAQREEEKREVDQSEEKWAEFIARFSTVLSSCAHGQPGQLNREEFNDMLDKNPNVMKSLRKLDARASIDDLVQVFDKLVADSACDGAVEIESIVDALSNQGGAAKASGVFELKYALAAARRDAYTHIQRSNSEVVGQIQEVKSGATAVEAHIGQLQTQLLMSQNAISALRTDLATVVEALKVVAKRQEDAARERRELNGRMETVSSQLAVQALASRRSDEKVDGLAMHVSNQLGSHAAVSERVNALTGQLAEKTANEGRKLDALTMQLESVALHLLGPKPMTAVAPPPIANDSFAAAAADVDGAEAAAAAPAAAAEPGAEPAPVEKGQDPEKPGSEPETTAEPEIEVQSSVSTRPPDPPTPAVEFGDDLKF